MTLRPIRLTVGSKPLGKAITWSYPSDDEKTYLIPTYSLTIDGSDAAGCPVRHTVEVIRFGIHRKSSRSQAFVCGLADQQVYPILNWLPNYRVHSFPSKEDGAWHVIRNYLIHDGPDAPMSEKYATAGCIEVCGGPHGFRKFNDLVIDLSGSTKSTRDAQLMEIGRSRTMTITYMKAVRPPLVYR
jgi:hypothetical protein